MVSESELLLLVESAPDAMMLVDDLGSIMYANSQSEVLFARTRADLIGLAVESLLPESFRRIHIAHRADYSLTGEVRFMGAGLDLFALRSDGSEFPVEVSLSPLESDSMKAVIVSVRDVSDRVALERRIHATEAAFRDAFDHAPTGIATGRLTDDGQWIVERTNRALCALLGYSEVELIGIDLTIFSHPDDVSADRTTSNKLLTLSDSKIGREQRYLRRNGTYGWVLVQSQTTTHGGITNFLSHVLDITDRIASEKDRQRLEIFEDRERIARDLHDVVIQRIFAAGLSLESLRGHISPASASDKIQAAVDQLDYAMRELRSTIFGLSSFETFIPVEQQIRDLVAAHHATLGFQPDVVLDEHIDSVPLVVIEQLLPTLNEALSNVARHAKATGVNITIDLTEHDLELTVTDNGQGIDPEVVRGHGLSNLEQRAARLGGAGHVSNLVDGGVQVSWQVPV